MTTSVEDTWYSLTRELDVDSSVAARWFEEIQRRYGEPQRHYHTLQHIADLVGLYEEYRHLLKKKYLVLLAIFFHDIIYDPKRPDNEEKSADSFIEFSNEAKVLSDDDTAAVKDWILATKEHKVEVDEDGDRHFMLDMDMAILGSPEDVYDHYAAQIRSEYCHYKDQDFNRGRAKVLRNFRKNSRIYSTKIFHDRFDKMAKTNADREIQHLESMINESQRNLNQEENSN